jgi:16S rRNA (adenine1518-N6/adenine1519-N6)-dimethyltransferase
MSLEETKSLLRDHRISPNKLLGQNFLVDPSIFPRLSSYAKVNADDTVLDAGAGFGFLTRFLANRCKAVVAIEKDPHVAFVLREQIRGLPNVTLLEGDVLKVPLPAFNKAISIPPYYLSTQLVTWLLDHSFDYAVLIVQKEFANRLVATVGSEDYGWLTLVTYQAAEAELLDEVPKWMFHPQPEVDSIILRLKPHQTSPFTVKNSAFFRRLAKWLFTQRNKKLGNALGPFIRSELKLSKADAQQTALKFTQRDKRVRDLVPEDFGQ